MAQEKKLVCVIDRDSKDLDDAYEVLKDEDYGSLKKQYPGTNSMYIILEPLLDCCLQTNLFEYIP